MKVDRVSRHGLRLYFNCSSEYAWDNSNEGREI